MNTSEKIWTFAAIFISCLALVVSIVQTAILQKQSHAAVWPRLSNGQGQGPDYYVYTVKNNGVGPALVSEVTYTYKDTTFQYINKLIYYFGDLEAAETGSAVKLNFQYSNIAKDDVLAPSQKVEVYKANDSISTVIGKKYLSKTLKKITYCSIYDRCWKITDEVIKKL